MEHFNVLEAPFARFDADAFDGAVVEGRLLHQTTDHVTLVTRYPEGAEFTFGAEVTYQETFCVIAGTGQDDVG